MAYKFRLTFWHPKAGRFPFDEAAKTVAMDDGLALVARNADSLTEATQFHFEGGGYENEKAARVADERLRVRLRVLNALLNLGIAMPAIDSTSARLSAPARKAAEDKSGIKVLDTISGVGVFPDDGNHG